MAESAPRDFAPPSVPTATYRLQFGPEFGFRDAAALVPYLDALGISHVYASPILKARRGSTHGYDITDHNALNDELGDERDFDDFVDALHRRGMGLILDFVPNHMGIGRDDNEWWLDVLEWGPASPYAAYFDIDWQPAKRELRGKVLLPFLGDHYGTVLETGELALRFDADSGSFSVWYHEHRFPVAPHLYARVLVAGLEDTWGGDGGGRAVLEGLIAELRALRSGRLPAGGRIAARAAAEGLKRQLADAYRDDERIRDRIQQCLDYFNGRAGDARSFMPLHRLLERQHYRLAFWRVAADEINYRRFFDINELAALRMESPELFATAHRLIARWVAEGRVQGLRFDHVDGLFDPRGYCRAVRDLVAATAESGSAAGDPPVCLWVEKILAAHERLPDGWGIAGTTGYEFANQLNGLLVDSAAESDMVRVYRRYTGEERHFDEILRACKLRIMDSALSGELLVLARDLDRISESNWQSRDFTLEGLHNALRQVVAEFGVYRTYIEDRHVTDDDRQEILRAVAASRARNPEIDPDIFTFVAGVLTTDIVRRPRSGYRRRQVVRFAMKFQQYTGPVMARSMEDTAFYRFHRLVSLNEVGGDPGAFGASVDDFHRANLNRQQSFPYNMLATTTHDTKRDEDVRARIHVLSEIPDEWQRRIDHWSDLNRPLKSLVDGAPAPSANDEYLLYQTLVGAWPAATVGAISGDCADLGAIRGRIEAYMIKAVREAKTHSSWSRPNVAYEGATSGFIQGLLDASRSADFLDAFLPFQASVAWFGAINGLSQTALKLTAPGIPDIYQGTESWSLRLVDPDNRRPVAFPSLADELATLPTETDATTNDAASLPRRLLDGWQDGRVKLWLTRLLLRLRRENSDLFLHGSYIAGASAGTHADNVCAFARRRGNDMAVVVAPRLMARLLGFAVGWPGGEAVWRDTSVSLPWDDDGGDFHDVVTGRPCVLPAADGRLILRAAEVFDRFPVAVLVRA